MTTDTIPARLVALKTTPTSELKRQWRELFDSDPPPFNRRYLESRLAYRIQELAYGGLKPERSGGWKPSANSWMAATARRAASAPTSSPSPARGCSGNGRASSMS
jgi:hypothetical protein